MTTTGGFWSQIIWMKSEMVSGLGPEPLRKSIDIQHMPLIMYSDHNVISIIHLVKQCRQISVCSPEKIKVYRVNYLQKQSN